MIRFLKLIIIFFPVFLFSCNSNQKAAPELNELTETEKKEGWQLLFDGKSFDGWRGLGRETVPKGHWIIEDNCIKKVKSGDVPLQADGQPLTGGDLLILETYENFEFAFEWKISSAGNSGIKYNVSEEMSTSNPPQNAALGFEYQILDDDKHNDGANATHRTAGLYDLISPENIVLKPVGEFNQSKIVFNGNHGEHWLNDKKVLEYDLGSERMYALLAASKYKNYSGFGDKRKGHIVLQDHTDDVWYRNLKIKILK